MQEYSQGTYGRVDPDMPAGNIIISADDKGRIFSQLAVVLRQCYAGEESLIEDYRNRSILPPLFAAVPVTASKWLQVMRHCVVEMSECPNSRQ
jgi:hypothetical protein